MPYVYEKLNIVLWIVKLMIINVGTFFIFLKLSNKQIRKMKKIRIIVEMIIPTFIYIKINLLVDPINAIILMIISLLIIFKLSINISLGHILVETILALCISYSLYFIATAINSIPNILLKVNSEVVAFSFINLIYLIILCIFMKNKRMDKGISFLNKENKNEFFDMLILNIGIIILFSLEMFGNYNAIFEERIGTSISIFVVIMFLTIKKAFNVYYKQKLLFQQLAEANNEIQEKQKEIERLEEENLNFSKRSHSMAHKQEALEYKLNQLLMNEKTTKEIGIVAEIKELSKELYQKPIEELTKTGIQKIDDMLKFMQSECIKNNIDINLQITGNVYHIINNIITVEQLEILIADHIKDAIIAIKHTDNVNKSILVKLGKIDECYGLYIYDSGIEFEKETLENLGKKPSTTHKDEGGTGMGFMNTFDTLRSCKGILIIKEIGKPSKDNFTKIIMIKFDGKNEYKVIPYR